jgi:hypothetical protein
MIEIRNLKINNYLLLDGEPELIWGLDLDLQDEGWDLISIGEYSLETVRWFEESRLTYITLTAEHLIKAGFNKDNFLHTWHEGKMRLWIGENEEGFYLEGTDYPLKYLHQLQNLYCALTEEDLNITL